MFRVLIAAGFAGLMLAVATAGTASAHGAPQYPVSRSVACGSEGKAQSTAACRAARAGGKGAWFDQWDNVRVAGVNGRDRQVIPDGELCSGGIEGFGGLDRARSDWPATTLRAGRSITFRYRATIPHQGTFRVFVTRNGYDPTRALGWADLQPRPFLTATDPGFSGGAYTFRGALPRGKTGRHLLFTVWQNSSTPDTYYSCSDVVFTGPARATATAAPSPRVVVAGGAARKATSASARAPRASTPAAPVAPAEPTVEASDPAAVGDVEALAAVGPPAAAAGGFRFGSGLIAAALLALAGAGGGVVRLVRARRLRGLRSG